MLNDTLKYQKKYGFEIGENNLAVDNESDAFRHTYMQIVLAQRYSPYLGKKASEFHEWQGNHNNQDL